MALVTGSVFPLLAKVPSKGNFDFLPALHSLNECGHSREWRGPRGEPALETGFD